jgi:3-hydroxyisobutyrate dehydrogenase
MLPGPTQVREVFLGKDGVLDNAKRGVLCIDSSTVDPQTAKDVGAEATKRGLSFADAPVSVRSATFFFVALLCMLTVNGAARLRVQGGVMGAEKATLTFMVGGPEATFNMAKAPLAAMGKNIVHCGEVGSGQAAKLCNNLALAIQMVAVSEAMHLGISLGMEPKTLAGIFNTSTARCWSSDTYNPVPGVMEGVPAARGYTGGFFTDLMRKDLGLAMNAAHQVKAPTPVGALVTQLYNLHSAKGNGGRDFSSIYELIAAHSSKSP